jgi:hypothetical protein
MKVVVVVASAVMAIGCRQLLGFESPSAMGNPSDAPPVETDAPVDVSVGGWAFRKPLTIDRSEVAGALTQFPVLVRFAVDADLAAAARSDGFDLMFVAADGTTKLAHERERYDSTTGELVAWVALPDLSPNSDTTLFLYFGNADATDQQNPTAVWDSNFVGVWHLGETVGPTIADSTSAGRTGTKTSAGPSPAAGIIGRGQLFGGGADGIAIGNASALNIASITFETWIDVSACGNDVYRRIVDFPVAFSNAWVVSYPCSGAPVVNAKSIVIDSTTGQKLQTAANSLTPDQPHHLVFQSNPLEIWVDGTKRLTSDAPFGLEQTAANAVIGNREGSPDRAVAGTMDEVRISRVRRSQDWIVTSHNSQRPGATFVSVGAVEDVP